ncbi:MAG: RidA family protein [Woeseiaceae bacterium]|nr:RidA family protein [Woeseiaceae bacterium]
MSKEAISSDRAPAAIGTYSQAVKTGNLVFLSGQIPLVPETMEIVDGDFETRARQVFKNLEAVAKAAGGDLNDIVKITVFLTDLDNFATVNSVMESFFDTPYPARAAVGVSSLPKGVDVEADAILAL